MDPFNLLVWWIAGKLGLSPGALAIIIGVIIYVSNATSKLIPDTATGWKGWVRYIAGWIGLHIRNNTGSPSIAVGPGTVIRTEPAKDAPPAAATLTELVEPIEPVVKDAFAKAAAASQTEGK